jgi:hypothetical protein
MFLAMSDKKPLTGKSLASTESDAGQPLARSAPSEIEAFLRQARAAVVPGGAGRLILALDATMSRQPTWDLACELQGEMFDAVGKTGSLLVQLVYFRGFGECRSSRFVADTTSLKQLMSRIDCRAGHTQVGKVLAHALKEAAAQKIAAVVYIGDAMEEKLDDLADKAGRLGMHGVPVFVFQEGRDRDAEIAFKEIVRLTRGAWFRFDRTAPSMLAKLLSSIAVFATGGLKALEARNRPEDRLMIEHLSGTR